MVQWLRLLAANAVGAGVGGELRFRVLHDVAKDFFLKP